jgi:hypothetical protein
MAKSSLPTNPFARFAHADQGYRQRLIGASHGEVGTGKTSFWLGAPGPIVVFSLDKGLEGVVEKYQADKQIYYKEYAWSPGAFDTDDEAKAAAVALRDEMIADYEHALTVARTVILDKETNIWEVFRYAEFGGPNDAPRNYPKLNQAYRHFVNLGKDTDLNIGFIQSMKDEWATVKKADGATKGAFTGKRVRTGFSELDELVHIDLRHRREGGKFLVDVGKSRGPGSGDIQDQTFEDLSFTDFSMLVFPDSRLEDWI